jgi:SNF2 family DNA or RNA helicase
MKKDGVKTDRKRRRKHVLALQDAKEWKKNKKLPPADATWPTCLIIAPATVVLNWEREFQTVCSAFLVLLSPHPQSANSGVTSKVRRTRVFDHPPTTDLYPVGKYVGTPEERKLVLEDFKKGRLDVGKCLFEHLRLN